MKYFMIEGTFKNPVPVKAEELKEAISAHLNHLQIAFDNGSILVTGPKMNTGGGIIVMKGSSLQEIEEYIAKDPLKVTGVQEYRIVEFNLHDCQSMIKEWFDWN